MRNNDLNNSLEHLTEPVYPMKALNIKVFMYHQVADDKKLCKKYWHCLHVDTFIEHLNLIEKLGYTTITFEDYRLAQQGKLVLPHKPVILTFDDGYENIYNLVLPLLSEYGMKAVAFVLGDRNIEHNVWDLEFNYPSFKLLSSEQIEEMAETVFEIGGHTLRHRMLLGLTKEMLWEEIYDSKKNIESIIHKPIRSFSYPYGGLDNHIKEIVHLAGYEYACSVATGPAKFGKDMLEIPRITIFNKTGYLRMAVRLITPFEQWVIFRRKIRLLLPNHVKSTGPEYDLNSEIKKGNLEANDQFNGSFHSVKH